LLNCLKVDSVAADVGESDEESLSSRLSQRRGNTSWPFPANRRASSFIRTHESWNYTESRRERCALSTAVINVTIYSLLPPQLSSRQTVRGTNYRHGSLLFHLKPIVIVTQITANIARGAVMISRRYQFQAADRAIRDRRQLDNCRLQMKNDLRAEKIIRVDQRFIPSPLSATGTEGTGDLSEKGETRRGVSKMRTWK